MRPVEGRRRLAVLTAARRPLQVLPAPDVPWPERLLCCALGDVEIVNLHSPISPAPELAKVRTHEAVAAYLESTAADVPRVLCGDLNTPRRELPDGTVLTFAHDSAGRLRPERGERWHRAESGLVYGLREQGWADAFRSLHGYGEREASWRFPQDRGGWRLDHVLVHGSAACRERLCARLAPQRPERPLGACGGPRAAVSGRPPRVVIPCATRAPGELPGPDELRRVGGAGHGRRRGRPVAWPPLRPEGRQPQRATRPGRRWQPARGSQAAVGTSHRCDLLAAVRAAPAPARRDGDPLLAARRDPADLRPAARHLEARGMVPARARRRARMCPE